MTVTANGGRLEFRILGPVQAQTAEHPVDLGERKQRLLLGVLLLEVNRVVPVSAMIDLLWPGDPPQTARRTIQAHLSRLRTALIKAEPAGRAVSLHRRGDGYLVSCDPACIDAYQFRALLDQARGCADDSQRARLLHQAVELWRGPALADAASADVRARLCGGLETARLTALEEYMDAGLRLGRHHELSHDLIDLVTRHQHNQRFAAQLMLALYRSGRIADALDVFTRTRLRLSDDLGLDPSTDLRRLHMAILRGDRELDLTAAAAGAPRSADVEVPAQLPAVAPNFTGRADLLRRLDGELTREPAGVVAVAVTGAPGVGKTALAITLADRVAARFPDGQLYVSLGGHSAGPTLTAHEALAMALGGLGVAADRVPRGPAAAAGLYRTLVAGRRILVVLDGATTAEQVRPLLPGSPTCRVLVTSRNHLTGLVARDGVRLVRLGGLSAVEALELLTSILGADRTGAEPAAAAELVERCDHLPLALRIAAANLAARPHLTLSGYCGQLADDPLSELQVPDDAASSVAEAFTRSYRSLPPPAQRLFRWLAVAPAAGLSVEAVAALAGVRVSRIEPLLRELTTANLGGHRPDGRFAMPSLLARFAARQLDTEDGPAERRHILRRLLSWPATKVAVIDPPPPR